MVSAAASIAAQAIQQNRIHLEIHANNINNIASTAYKGQMVQAADSFYQNVDRANARVGQKGTGGKIVKVRDNQEIGNLKETKRPLDVAILAPGHYMSVLLPSGKVAYTRVGTIRRTAEGALVVDAGQDYPFENGLQVEPGTPMEDVEISDQGVITMRSPNDPAQREEIGQITLYRFPNDDALEKIGAGLYLENEASGDRVEVNDLYNKFRQGYIEESNVNSVNELIQLTQLAADSAVASKILEVDSSIQKAVTDAKT